MTYYRQCKLRRENTITVSGGYLWQTTWIPEKFAKEGRFVKLKKEDRQAEKFFNCKDSTQGPHMDYNDGWEVMSVGARADEVQMKMISSVYRRTRNVSDI